jgi:hypothetical protein
MHIALKGLLLASILFTEFRCVIPALNSLTSFLGAMVMKKKSLAILVWSLNSQLSDHKVQFSSESEVKAHRKNLLGI